MGTQQILLIVLSVIIVGIAIAVGIMMFNNQAYNSNQSAIAGELQNYAAQVIQWWKTPISQGGGGQLEANNVVANISPFIGFTYTPADGTAGTPEENLLVSENGRYTIATASGNTVVLNGIGNTKKGANYPAIITTVELNPGSVTSVVGLDADGLFPLQPAN
jgi:hypothetical protein